MCCNEEYGSQITPMLPRYQTATDMQHGETEPDVGTESLLVVGLVGFMVSCTALLLLSCCMNHSSLLYVTAVQAMVYSH